MKNLLNVAAKTKEIPFMETEKVEIRKLTVSQVKKFQALLESVKDKPEEDGLTVQHALLRMAVVGAEDLTDDELDSFPIEDINTLASDILIYAGVKAPEGNDSATKS